MKSFFKKHGLFLILILLLTSFHLGTLHAVPFHPDESSQIFMSEDLNRLFTNPLSMAWTPSQPSTDAFRMRKIDAPLTRYVIGLGLIVAESDPNQNNWDWGMSWKENIKEGALPTQRTLTASRAAVTMLLPFSLTFIYLFLIRVSNKMTALIGVLLMGIHPIVLLHARRAMAEGPILFGVSFFIWSLSIHEDDPWILGLAIAIAYNAKQSTAALLLAGIIAVSWEPITNKNLSKLIKNALYYLGIFMIVTLILNPILWKFPLRAFISGWQTRIDFTRQQVQTIQAQAPERILHTFPERILSMINNLYLNHPSIADVGNYLAVTQRAKEFYFQIPFTTFGRGMIWGSLFITLTLGGMYRILPKLFSPLDHDTKPFLFLFLSTLFLGGSLLIAIPLTWQRYMIPLLPFVTIWIALGLNPLITALKSLISPAA